jgi:hypothetical protein
MNLDDIVMARMSELAGILAACASVNPMKVLPLLDQLEDQHLTNVQARRYLLALRARYDELKAATDDERPGICLQTACGTGTLLDCAAWLSKFEGNAVETAQAAIDEIQRAIITMNYLRRLKTYIKACEEKAEWR